jgi:hypothetical protein
VYMDDVCSTLVRYIAPNTPLSVSQLSIGSWSYVWTIVNDNTKYLVDFRDTGLPESDPLLILGTASTISSTGVWKPTLPRLSGRYYEDYLSW